MVNQAYNDLERIKTTIPTVVAATPVREYKRVVYNQNNKLEARIVAVTPDFFRQSNIAVALGRGITDADDRKFDNVCVLGAATADKLFPSDNPVGRSVFISNAGEQKSYTVVGVTEPKTLAAGSDGGEQDYNHVMFIPFSTDKTRVGRQLVSYKATGWQIERLEVSQVTVIVDDTANVPKTAVVIQSLMDQFHPNKDVIVIVPLDLLRKAEETQQQFTLIIGAIAGISLVVGGIGIMNIMLATVTERTREIGIRRALGAKQRDIALQFLMETLVLSCGGGMLGIGLGVVLALVVSEGFGVPAMVRWWSPAVAFGVSLLVGLVSGIYPAWRAARLDPIEALRHN